MKNITGILSSAVLLLILRNGLSAQNIEKYRRNDCPGETITMHLSHECPFSGEVVWFRIYCSSPGFPGMTISSLCFVELVSADNISVIRKKIAMAGGGGSGELQIPENLSTGIYFLLAYTNWMKNFGENSFFRKKIVIVNPGEPYAPSTDSLNAADLYTSVRETTVSLQGIKITTDKTAYATREKVQARLIPDNPDSTDITGNFSVSVYRKEPDFGSFLGPYTGSVGNDASGPVHYLPDYKGIRLSGKLSDKNGDSVPGAQLIMSLPGPGTTVASCVTDSTGTFNFLLKPGEGDEDIVITLPDAEDKISLEEPFWNGFRKLPPVSGIRLGKESVEYFREKFTCFQLEKKFSPRFCIKHTTFINKPDSSVFYQKPYQILKLGNYIQLDSLGEYFHELVPSVRLVRRRGEYNLSFIDEKTFEYLDQKPAVFFDGVLFDSYGPIANFPSSEVDRISILPAAYYYKDFYFGGIVDIHSRKSDFNGVRAQENMTRFIYPKAAPDEFEYDPPDYSGPGSSTRTPDLRYLLCWQPDVRVSGTGTAAFDFYTGDIKGTYLITVTGMTADGKILKAEKLITVE